LSSKRVVAVALLVGSLGCGGEPEPLGDDALRHDACGPIAVLGPDSMSDVQRQGLARALQAWNAHGFTQLTTDPEGAPDVVQLRFQKAARLFFGFYDPSTGEVLINQDIDDPSELEVVISHELGHAMGLSHVSGSTRTSVMNMGNTTTVPNAADNDALVSTWSGCGR
jgi:hypothetical protein